MVACTHVGRRRRGEYERGGPRFFADAQNDKEGDWGDSGMFGMTVERTQILRFAQNDKKALRMTGGGSE